MRHRNITRVNRSLGGLVVVTVVDERLNYVRVAVRWPHTNADEIAGIINDALDSRRRPPKRGTDAG